MSKVSTLISSNLAVPLTDSTNSNNNNNETRTSSTLLYSDLALLPPPTFKLLPLPPLPSASTLQLPSFLNFSTPSPHSVVSLPASVLLPVSPPPRVKSRCNKVFEGPQWIPAFHHPNSPYVPWPPPVRHRILPPPSPVRPSPYIRSGAVAPEPWASSTLSQARSKPAKQKISSSWKSLKNSIKKGVNNLVSRLGKSKATWGTLYVGQGVACDDAVAQPSAMQSRPSSPRDSLASFVSSDSTTLAVWLAERRANASSVTGDTPREISMEEYELAGSWLDLRHCDGGWACGIKDCDMHTASGSPCTASDHANGFMPFGIVSRPIAPALPFPDGPFSVPLRFRSLPRLP